ncbi:hypothetical protein TSMEX_003841 [Taenia solium]|eukprot:TsM_000428300 transcript=TsM_000428300 gene=TsM_000428300
MWATSLTTSVQVISAGPTDMSVYIGEAIVLYGVALLNIVAFVNDGWICGRLCSQLCLESYVMLVVVGCLSVALLLSLIAAVLQTAAAASTPIPVRHTGCMSASRCWHASWRLRMCSPSSTTTVNWRSDCGTT